jgi:hypothetical protein
MKKGFGWFFVILGALNVFRGFAMISQSVGNGGGILFFGIGFIGLGIWMISSSKPKDDNNLPTKSDSNLPTQNN